MKNLIYLIILISTSLIAQEYSSKVIFVQNELLKYESNFSFSEKEVLYKNASSNVKYIVERKIGEQYYTYLGEASFNIFIQKKSGKVKGFKYSNVIVIRPVGEFENQIPITTFYANKKN